MDTIYIEDLRIDTVIGLYDWERRIRQTVRFDLDMAFDITAAAATDDVDRTLNYKAVAKRVIAFVEVAEFELVETLAERVAGLILDEFPVRQVRLRLNKAFALRGARGVGVEIIRPRADQTVAGRTFVGVGSNIEPARYIPQALQLMRARFGPLTVSPAYTCPAVGFDGPAFVNLVVAFDTGSDAAATAAALREIEDACGRARGDRSRSRTMDLDLLLVGDRVDEALRLPRDDILRYAFTLKPLADLAPAARHPVDGRRYDELWRDFDDCEQPLTTADASLNDAIAKAAGTPPR